MLPPTLYIRSISKHKMATFSTSFPRIFLPGRGLSLGDMKKIIFIIMTRLLDLGSTGLQKQTKSQCFMGAP